MKGIRVIVLCIALLHGVLGSTCGATAPLGPSPVSGGGVCFQVWAPHALSASVVGVGTLWRKVPMSNNGSLWTTFVEDAGPGDAYMYEFSTSNGVVQRLDPRAQIVGSTNTFSVVHDANFNWHDQHFTATPMDRAIVYELHIPSFSEDGTLRGAMNNLKHLSNVGVSHVELMPVTAFAGSTRGWGYNPISAFAIQHAYGYRELKEFVDAAHSFSIAVVLDVVFNHFDPSSWNMLLQYDGYAGPTGNGIYFGNTTETATTMWGPRPNFGDANVRAYLLDAMDTFVTQYHIDGFRVDATVCIRKPGKSCWTNPNNITAGWTFLQRLTSKSPFIVAEDDQGLRDITEAVNNTHAGIPGAKGGCGFGAQVMVIKYAFNKNDLDVALVGVSRILLSIYR
jgi:1,4-alpha-glucan branching enzyme